MAPKERKVSSATTQLDSAAATRVPTFTFKPIDNLDLPIVAFRCLKPADTCITLKRWLCAQFDRQLDGCEDLLRMESLELDQMQPRVEGTLLLLEGIAHLDVAGSAGRGDSAVRIEVGIFGLFMPRDDRVRWFYSVIPYSTILAQLGQGGMISIQRSWEPGGKAHGRLYTFVREYFPNALNFPHHPDYINAQSITDWAPDILDPDDALDRLERNQYLYYHGEELDISDDRYILDLYPAERYIASAANLRCAEYLFVKRTFFKDYYIEVHRSDKKIEQGERVRTDVQHKEWLEKIFRWKHKQARRLVVGWKELGLLDDRKFLPWVKQGGIIPGVIEGGGNGSDGEGTIGEENARKDSEDESVHDSQQE